MVDLRRSLPLGFLQVKIHKAQAIKPRNATHEGSNPEIAIGRLSDTHDRTLRKSLVSTKRADEVLPA